MSRTRIFLPPGEPPGAFANLWLDDCLAHPNCPTGYLAKGYLEMNAALRAAHERITELQRQINEPIKPAGYSTVHTMLRAAKANAKLRAKKRKNP